MLKKFLAAKTAAVTTVLALGVVAAGATAGVVDGPADPALDEVTTTVPEETTTSVPDETTTSVPEETTTTAPEETTTTSVPEETTTTVPEEPAPLTFERGPAPTGPARHGLCRAFGHRTEGPGRSVAAENLRAAAAHAGQSVADFCAEVLGGDAGEPDAEEPDSTDDRAAASERQGRPEHAGQGKRGNGNGNGKGRGRG